MNSHLRVAIVGAGPGGLLLACMLHRQNVPCTVFERDRAHDHRPQGGTLDLHPHTGQYALAQAGLIDAFHAVARHEDQGMRLLDHHANVLLDLPADGQGERPEIDRSALRHLLLDALPDGTVQWNHGLVSLRPASASASAWTLQFASGEAGPFDLVVGADGAWSQVRALLSPYQPQYSGLTFVEFGIDDADRRHPALAALVGHGTTHVEGLGRALIMQRNDHAHLRGYAVFRNAADWAATHFDAGRPAHARQALRRAFEGFAEEVLALFDASNDNIALRPIHALPVGHCWNARAGLTLLGDAAHLMSPFGGQGVNNALRDAAELAAALSDAQDWQAGVTAYEQAMFERVRPSAADAAEGAATFLSHDGVEQTLQHHRAQCRQLGDNACQPSGR